MATEVEGQWAIPLAAAERHDHRIPAATGSAEAVQEDDGLGHVGIVLETLIEPLHTHLLIRAFVDELARCGVREACTSPGSRSTPLVLALVRDEQIRCHSHVDERAAGFFALGVAASTGAPAAISCTSGTAAANYLPAVVEAFEAGLPLVVLTADRPPELRGVGAGQAIDQLGLYGRAAKWFFDVGTHEATPERLRWIRQLACRAVGTAREDRPGPVHLNFALREPLVPAGPLPVPAEAESGRPGRRPWTARSTARRDPGPLSDWLAGRRRGVVVAGTGATGADRLAERLGWPLLADPMSGARRGPAAIATYDALLRDGDWTATVPPDCVLRVGDLPTSKPLRTWLSGLEVPQAALMPPSVWHDPAAVLSDLFELRAPDLDVDRLELPGPAPRWWLETWLEGDRVAAAAIAEVLAAEGLCEPAVARELVAALPDDAQLVVAGSMPVRDVESFAAPTHATILANRGANGIDGTVSTAYGAAASGLSTALLIGDVALAHDLGGLLAGPRLDLPLTIVLIDNAGGGIFEFLPTTEAKDVFEEHIATPTGLDAQHIATLFGARFTDAGDLAELRTTLRAQLGQPGTTIIRVRTDRSENVRVHRRCWEAVARALAAQR
jgi:2-succinyl-5-enolpyruvyl-6-hydroxy-3-cyclohexene-1-carboxylate synthase